MSDPDLKRRWLLVDKERQMKIVSYSVLHAVIAVAVTAGVAVEPMLHAMLKSNDQNVQFYSGLAFLTFCQRLLPLAAILFVSFTLHLLLVTKRIFFPLAQFRAAFKRIAGGDLSEGVSIQKRDYLQQDCESVNDMIDELSDRLRRLVDTHADLSAALDRAGPTSQESLHAIRAEAARMAELLAELRLQAKAEEASGTK